MPTQDKNESNLNQDLADIKDHFQKYVLKTSPMFMEM